MIDIDGGFGTVFSYRLQGPPRAAQRHRRLRRRPRAARPHRRLPRPARLHLAARRRGADQRLQLPRLGHAREARAGLRRRPAVASSSRPARRPTSPSSSSAGSSSPASSPRARSSCCPARAGDLLDHLGVQDSVAFTGSAHTAGILRQHPSVLHGGVTLQVEADSLNCSVLGPDVDVDDPELDLFVKGVVTEMTAKAGQKCTAIRRVIVPAAVADEVTEAITARLVDDHRRQPRRRVGADGPARLASASARRSARPSRRCARRPTSCTATPTVDLGFDGDAERGAFMSPVLLAGPRRRGRAARRRALRPGRAP